VSGFVRVNPLLRETCRCEPQGEIPEGKAPYFRLPIFNYHDGYLSTSYTATYYELAQRHPEVPRLTELQREAVRHFNALARVRGLGLPSRAGTIPRKAAQSLRRSATGGSKL